MPVELNKILEYLLHQTIQTIIIKPSYKAISEFNLKINTNVMSMQSHRGNGLLGLLFPILKVEACNTQ